MRLGPLRVEDVLLGAANLIAPSLFGGGINLDAAPDTGLGLLMVLALAAAVVGIGLRPAVQPSLRAGPVQAPRWGLIGPLMGGLFFVGMVAGEQLGMSDGSPIGGGAIVLAGAAAATNQWLPVADPAVRRALVTPFVLVCSGLFAGFAGGIVGSIDVGAMIRDAPAVGTSFALFVAVLLTGGIAVYYTMFVAAPRELADPEGRSWVWIPRFVLFLATALIGFGPIIF